MKQKKEEQFVAKTNYHFILCSMFSTPIVLICMRAVLFLSFFLLKHTNKRYTTQWRTHQRYVFHINVVVITFTFFFPLFILCSFDFDLTTNSALVQTQSAFYLHILFSHLYNNSKKKFNSTMFHSIYICTLIKMHFTKIHLRAIFWKHSHKKTKHIAVYWHRFEFGAITCQSAMLIGERRQYTICKMCQSFRFVLC